MERVFGHKDDFSETDATLVEIRHTWHADRLDSFVKATAGRGITYKELIV